MANRLSAGDELSATLQRWLPGSVAAAPSESAPAKAALPVFDDQALTRLIGPNCPGVITPEEKQKMIKFIESNDSLSIYPTSDVIKAFQEFITQLEFDKDIGEAKAYQALGKMKTNAEAARLLMRMIIAIAASDGNFDSTEKAIASKIAKELGLNPTEFELG